MVSQELLDYVKKELARGIHEDRLRQVLLENDWPEFEINEAFEKAKQFEQEKAVENPSEEVLKETVKKPEEILPEEKPKKIRKVSVIQSVQKIVANKVFIVAFIVIILGSVAFFILPSIFKGEEGVEGDSNDVVEEAKKACTQYCNSNLCGLFINPEFPQSGLEGKNCLDLGVECKQPDGKPKCEVEY